MNAVCARAWPVKCHAPLDITPFSLQVSGVGTLAVPYGTNAAVAVANFANQALDAGHAIDAAGEPTSQRVNESVSLGSLQFRQFRQFSQWRGRVGRVSESVSMRRERSELH